MLNKYTAAGTARQTELKERRDDLLKKSRAIVDGDKAKGRQLTPRKKAVAQAMADIRSDDEERLELGSNLAKSVMALGTPDEVPEGDQPTLYISFRGHGTKAQIAAKAGDRLHGRKSLDGGSSL